MLLSSEQVYTIYSSNVDKTNAIIKKLPSPDTAENRVEINNILALV